MSRSGSIKKKVSSATPPNTSKQGPIGTSQEVFKGLQTSFHEMLVLLSTSLSFLTDQIKGLYDKMDGIQKQLTDNQKEMIDMMHFKKDYESRLSKTELKIKDLEKK